MNARSQQALNLVMQPYMMSSFLLWFIKVRLHKLFYPGLRGSFYGSSRVDRMRFDLTDSRGGVRNFWWRRGGGGKGSRFWFRKQVIFFSSVITPSTNPRPLIPPSLSLLVLTACWEIISDLAVAWILMSCKFGKKPTGLNLGVESRPRSSLWIYHWIMMSQWNSLLHSNRWKVFWKWA